LSTKTVNKIQYWTGVPESAKPYVLATSPLAAAGAVLLFSKNSKTWLKQIQFWQKNQNSRSESPRRQILLLDLNSNHHHLLSCLQNNQPSIFITPLHSLEQKIPSPEELKNQSLHFQSGQKINLPKVIGGLLGAGYRKEKNADTPGCFALRGGIIDIFPIFHARAIRLELFGDKIESIKIINNNLIMSFANEIINNLTIPPLNIKNPRGTILDWLHQNATIILDEPEPDLKKKLAKFNLVVLEAFPPTQENITKFDFRQIPLFFGKLDLLREKTEQYKNKKYQIFTASNRLDEIENKLPFALSAGFWDPGGRLLVLTDTEIFGFRKTRQKSRRFELDAEFLANLVPGMHIVHIDHGIGKFIGMVERELDQIKREYFCLEYGMSDKLFLPIDQAEKITRYIGRENPILHRLHGGIWHEIKKQAAEDSRKMAEELLKIQASRETEKGFVFGPDTIKQDKMEASFPYTETPDQEKAINDVKADMESAKPMDRLICGDVGFGKTEVAMRAAFKARENQKQVCLLAPTTILAQQHFDTFQKRLKPFGVKVALLTRFQNHSRQKQILLKLCQGEIDIVIGTHRLLSSDVKFFNLGLVIIDEEQRFGVRHKEKLKSLRPNLDILTLSATPIPRTLHFALSGLREISAIQTPPPGRKVIKTRICLRDEAMIQKAIRNELERKGQIYYLYNKVETIFPFAKKIKGLVPEATIDVAHGQMLEKDLARVMSEFDQGKIQILVATTIIENGLDLPNVNTLLVDDAPSFGLSQLYQIRGRIGRSLRQAYAYFFYRQEKLPERARHRLQALLAMQSLGSGFQIAMRDLEIRGAGNILGREQSGNVNALGLHLYAKLLNQTIRELKTGKSAKSALEVSLDLPLSSRLPREFIASEKERLNIYHQLSDSKSFTDLRVLRAGLVKKYGQLPAQANNLFEILKIKILARRARICEVGIAKIWDGGNNSERKLVLTFAQKFDWEKVKKLRDRYPAWNIGENKLKIDFPSLGKDWIGTLKQSLKILSNATEQ